MQYVETFSFFFFPSKAAPPTTPVETWAQDEDTGLCQLLKTGEWVRIYIRWYSALSIFLPHSQGWDLVLLNSYSGT